MRVIVLLIALLPFVSANVSAQTHTPNTNYDFLGNLHFKNGKATTTFKAAYTGAVRNGDYYFFRDVLDKKKILESKKYFSVEKVDGEGELDAGSSIIFVPDNNSKEYVAPIALDIDWGQFKVWQTLLITCTVYQGIHRIKNQPFYVIDRVSIAPQYTLRQQTIKPLVYLDMNRPDRGDFIGYFTDLGSSPEGLNWLLLITPKNQIILETAGHRQHIFNFLKRTPTIKGFIDSYKDGDDWLEINIERVINRWRAGTLTLNLSNSKRTINVYGQVDENPVK